MITFVNGRAACGCKAKVSKDGKANIIEVTTCIGHDSVTEPFTRERTDRETRRMINVLA